ncbi:phosphate ABC transporter ATP-binding protein PstB [Mycoplasma sp. E35C]|uniref:phosphate ABC transporter ATP-binding protein PstB n=1 Tax=Mycoplasma sp. E35C TaxID=2801918 RepID=UPI001CA3FF59|nr:phosphate ABC transporter ATP-binding protein [Mycoplasma sp. E35C]
MKNKIDPKTKELYLKKKAEYKEKIKNLIAQKKEVIKLNDEAKLVEITAKIKRYKILYNNKDPNLIHFKEDYNFDNIFEVDNFNLWYNNGSKHALKDLNVNIKKNKVTALIGPSGCGKSTFIRSLNRMHDLTDGIIKKGSIFFLSKNIYSKTLPELELRSKVGMVFQKPTPFSLSIYENIAFALKSHGMKNKAEIDQIVKESLEGAALWDDVKDILYQSAHGLSGGQQQRLSIARAIALKPDVLLMDEPTSALDPIATNKIEILIHKLKKTYSIVIVTHSMAQAQRVSDETIFFYEGKVLEQGTTKQIFTQPKNEKTKDYINGRIG